MAKKAAAKAKKRVGRPRTNPTSVRLMLLPEALAGLDRFAAEEGLTRGMAARRIIEEYLKSKG